MQNLYHKYQWQHFGFMFVYTALLPPLQMVNNSTAQHDIPPLESFAKQKFQ